MSFTFDEESHTYKLNGEVLPSVSQIIKGTEESDPYDNIPSYILERAAEIGREVHKTIEERHAKGWPLVTEDDSANAYLRGYKDFLDSGVFQWRTSEHRMYCEDCWYAGTVDLIGELNSAPALIDIKTTSQLDKEYVRMQTAAYSHLWEANTDDSIDKTAVCWLKKGDYELITLDRDMGWIEFQGRLQEYHDATS